MAITAGDHRQTSKTTFGDLGLPNEWGSPPDHRCGLLHPVRKCHAIARSEPARGAADIIQRLEHPFIEPTTLKQSIGMYLHTSW
jgi:hypothetical protein